MRNGFELIGLSCNIKPVKTSQHFRLFLLFKDKLKIAVKKKRRLFQFRVRPCTHNGEGQASWQWAPEGQNPPWWEPHEAILAEETASLTSGSLASPWLRLFLARISIRASGKLGRRCPWKPFLISFSTWLVPWWPYGEYRWCQWKFGETNKVYTCSWSISTLISKGQYLKTKLFYFGVYR